MVVSDAYPNIYALEKLLFCIAEASNSECISTVNAKQLAYSTERDKGLIEMEEKR